MIQRISIIVLLSITLLGASSCTDNALNTAKDTAIKGVQVANKVVRESGDGYIRNLTEKQKQAIDNWLKSNDLNEYGDESGTEYSEGNPLFDQKSGESINRFVYLFEKYPNLKDVVNHQLEMQDE